MDDAAVGSRIQLLAEPTPQKGFLEDVSTLTGKRMRHGWMAAEVSLMRARARIGQLCLEPTDDARLGVHHYACPQPSPGIIVLSFSRSLRCFRQVAGFPRATARYIVCQATCVGRVSSSVARRRLSKSENSTRE